MQVNNKQMIGILLAIFGGLGISLSQMMLAIGITPSLPVIGYFVFGLAAGLGSVLSIDTLRKRREHSKG